MITVETVHNACRAAYKKGLIDAAQVICQRCRDERSVRGPKGDFQHGNGFFECSASKIMEVIEFAGGWEAGWPKPLME